jgi:hypothetical protein
MGNLVEFCPPLTATISRGPHYRLGPGREQHEMQVPMKAPMLVQAQVAVVGGRHLWRACAVGVGVRSATCPFHPPEHILVIKNDHRVSLVVDGNGPMHEQL